MGFEAVQSKKIQKDDIFWIDKFANFFLVEGRQKTRVKKVMNWAYYILDYIIILCGIFITIKGNLEIVKQQSTVFYAQIALLFCNVITIICYIIIQNILFLNISKLLVVTQLLIQKDQMDHSFMMISLLASIICTFGWILTKQQRMVHFDSRLELISPLFKQLMVYFYVGLFITYSNIQRNQQILTTLVISMMIVLDYQQVLYSLKTKQIFLGFDCFLIFIFMSVILAPYSFSKFISLLIIGVTSLVIFIFFNVNNKLIFPSVIFNIKINNLYKENSQTIIQCFIELKMLEEQRSFYFKHYYHKLLKQCTNLKMKQQLEENSTKSLKEKLQTIKNIKYKILKNNTFNEQIKNFFIFYFSPDTRIFSVLDAKLWEHRREYRRITSNESIDNAIKIIQAEKQMKLCYHYIKKFTNEGCRFYTKLKIEKINFDDFIDRGINLVDSLRQIENRIVKNKHKFTQDVRTLYNNFLIKVLNKSEKLLQRKQDEPYLLQRTSQNPACLIISAEQNNFGKITELNTNFKKITYFNRDEIVNISMLDLLPLELYKDHEILINQKSKKRHFSGKTNFPKEVFFKNKLGYLILALGDVYELNKLEGRCWCAIFYQSYQTKSMMVISKARQYKGVTELGRYHDLDPCSQVKIIREDIIQDILQNGTIYVNENQTIFEGDSFTFKRPKKLILQKKVTYSSLNYDYYLVEILNKTKSSLKTITYLEKQSDQNSLSCDIEFQEKNETNFQYYYHWKTRKITNYPPKYGLQSFSIKDIKSINSISSNNNIDSSDINEMRLFNNKLDCKENFNIENQFESKEEKVQRKYHLNSQQRDAWVNQEGSRRPLWLKLNYMVVILLTVVFLACNFSVLIVGSFKQSSVKQQMLFFNKMSERQVKIYTIVQIIIQNKYKNILASEALIEQVEKHLQLINLLSQDINEIKESLELKDKAIDFQESFRKFQEEISDFVTNSNTDLQALLAQFQTQVEDKYQSNFNKMIDEIKETNKQKDSFANSLIWTSISIGIVFLIYLIILQYFIKSKEVIVVELWRQINNEYLDEEIVKLNNFQKEYIFQQDIKSFKSNNEKESNNYPTGKKIISNKKFLVSLFIWSILLAAFSKLGLLNSQTVSFSSELSDSYFGFNSDYKNIIINNQKIWVEFNRFPINRQLLQQNFQKSLDFQHSQISKLVDLKKKQILSSSYGQNFQQFWYCGKFCQQMNQTNCTSLLKGALTKGASMPITFLNLQYDMLFGENFTNNTIQSYSRRQEVSQILTNYLSKIVPINNQKLQTEMKRQIEDNFEKRKFLFLLIIICCCFISTIAAYFYWRYLKILKLQDTIKFIEIKKLNQLDALYDLISGYDRAQLKND